MIVREITNKDKEAFDSIATHPLQSYAWGQFRQNTGVRVVRMGAFEEEKLLAGYQITIHPVPHTHYTIGYFPKGQLPDELMLKTLMEVGKKYRCIFIKLEPNVTAEEFAKKAVLALSFPLQKAYKPLFTQYSFVLDLTSSIEELLKNMKSKTRYNTRLAEKKGVVIQNDDSQEAFEKYLSLTRETTTRQKFYAHDENYHRKMWDILHKAGIAHLFTATYQNEIIVTWIVFLFNDVLYYPYGASSDKYREVMASNLIMWEVIKWGKKHGAQKFDMWGALGKVDPKDPWYGFHRFKEGYGATLTEFAGSFDLVLHPLLYKAYTVSDTLRWILLTWKK